MTISFYHFQEKEKEPNQKIKQWLRLQSNSLS